MKETAKNTNLILKCSNCGRPIEKNEDFGFCAICGAPICEKCMSYSYVPDKIEVTKETPFTTKTIEYTLKLPVCKNHYDGFSSLRDLEDFVDNEFILRIPLFSLFFSFMFIIFIGIYHISEYDYLMYLFGGFVLSGILALGFWALLSILSKRGIPLHYINRLTCPVCGKPAKSDYITTTERISHQTAGISDQLKKFVASHFQGYRKEIPDVLECSNCGYVGPFTKAIGLRKFVKRYGDRLLENTFWKQYTGNIDKNIEYVCPYCNNPFLYPVVYEDTKVKCPVCGKELLMRKAPIEEITVQTQTYTEGDIL